MTVPVRVTPPADLPVTLAEARAQCRVDGTEEDGLLTQYIEAATAHLDGYRGVTGRCIMPQVWQEDFDGWGKLRLTLPDVTNISVRYCTEEHHGNSQNHVWVTLHDFETGLDALGHWVSAQGPSASCVRVEYTAGLTSELLPVARQAVLMMVAHSYENRETVSVGAAVQEMPFAATAMINQMRWRRL